MPIGGNANGIPKNESTPEKDLPTNVPLEILTVGELEENGAAKVEPSSVAKRNGNIVDRLKGEWSKGVEKEGKVREIL